MNLRRKSTLGESRRRNRDRTLWAWGLLHDQSTDGRISRIGPVIQQNAVSELGNQLTDNELDRLIGGLRDIGAATFHGHRPSGYWFITEPITAGEYNLHSVLKWTSKIRYVAPDSEIRGLVERFANCYGLCLAEAAAAIIAAEADGQVITRYDHGTLVGLAWPEDEALLARRLRKLPLPSPYELELAISLLAMAPWNRLRPSANRGDALVDGGFNSNQAAAIVSCLERIGHLPAGGVEGSYKLLSLAPISGKQYRSLAKGW